jgi:ABC-type anion transport system duplicated permease subunit
MIDDIIKRSNLISSNNEEIRCRINKMLENRDISVQNTDKCVTDTEPKYINLFNKISFQIMSVSSTQKEIVDILSDLRISLKKNSSEVKSKPGLTNFIYDIMRVIVLSVLSFIILSIISKRLG